MSNKPPFEEYCDQVIETLGFKEVDAAARKYEFNIRAARQSVSNSAEMRLVIAELKSMPDRYASGKPHLLFYPAIPEEVALLTKPFSSVLDKLYRTNVLYNRKYPQAPVDGGAEPKQLYEKINDLLRNRLVCKYMDGPRFVCDELKRLCDENNIVCNFKELSTEAGYYAWHFYLQVPVELMLESEVAEAKMWVEIQISTQLAEVITALTHELYEERRSGGKRLPNNEWKWDASSHNFRSAYLGHGLHLLEGVIQNLKDDLLARRSKNPERTDDKKTGVTSADEAAVALAPSADTASNAQT